MPRLKSLPPGLSGLPGQTGSLPRAEAERARNQERSGREPWRRWYGLKRWQDLRLEILERDGFMCQGCEVPHLLTGKAPAPHSAVIDHKTPHKGNPALFWDPDNLQAVCKGYHDTEKQRLEKGGSTRRMGRGGSNR